MAHKKKYLIGFYILFLMLFVLLLGSFSTCCAVTKTTLTDDEAQYLYNNTFTSQYYGAISPTTSSNYVTISSYNHWQTFQSLFNQKNSIDLQYGNVFFIPMFWNSSSGWLLVVNANAGKNGNLPHLYAEFGNPISGGKRTIKFHFIDDNGIFVDETQISYAEFSMSSGSFTLSDFYSTSFSYINTYWTLYYYYNEPYNSENSDNRLLLAPLNHITTFNNTNTIYTNWDGFTLTNTAVQHLLQTNFVSAPPYVPEPDIPEDTGNTGQITDDNGDVTGNIDLSGIQNSLGNIDNTTTQIEQNTQTIIQQQQQIQEGMTTSPDMSETEIDSEDITENIDFGLITNNSTLNGYSNFWLTLTDGLRGALTGNVRSIDINFRGETYTISLDNFSIQLPQQLKFILGMISTIYFVILIVKWWKIIIDKITGGDIDEVLAMNEEERNY